MKKICSAVVVAILLLNGCASPDDDTPHHEEKSQWNPLNWPWSILNPVNWFSRSLVVSEHGVGLLTLSTPMDKQAIHDGLDGHYELRSGMYSDGAQLVKIWQALKEDQLGLVIIGHQHIERIDILDPKAVTTSGIKLGTAFGDIYSRAFGHCEKGGKPESDAVLCQAPASQHIHYLFSGKWQGPEGLMPSDDVLKTWTLSKIIWQ
ncbi:RpoE-regulated lipoprotein [Enterobacteriaceae bacterium LUAb1]